MEKLIQCHLCDKYSTDKILGITVHLAKVHSKKGISFKEENPEGFKKWLWAQVDVGEEDECWLWQRGRPSISFDRKPVVVSHIIWELTKDTPIKKFVNHTCANSLCVNPAHLYTSDVQCTTSWSDIIEIRRLATEGVSQKAIGEKFGKSLSSIHEIVRHPRYDHIHDPVPLGEYCPVCNEELPSNKVVLHLWDVHGLTKIEAMRQCPEWGKNLLMEKINKKGANDCWEWGSSVNANTGHGLYWYRDGEGTVSNAKAHRLMYEIVNNTVLTANKEYVLRKCNNALCCNPKHLTLGSARDVARLRIESMMVNGTATNINTVKKIKKLLKEGTKLQKEIALETGVSINVVNGINCGKYAWV